MTVWTQIAKWFTKIFMPWFIKHAWPVIKDHIVGIFVFILKTLKDKVTEFISRKSAENKETAKQHAEDAENKAKNAASNTEKEKLEAIAIIWREVADMFRRENEELKERIDSIVFDSEKEVCEQMNNLDLSMDLSKDGTLLTIGGTSKQLPAPEDNS